MSFEKTDVDGLFVIYPKIISDNRGYFFEAFNNKAFRSAGIDYKFVQENQSMSIKNVLRGVHVQRYYPQAKLVRVISGAIWDVAVDMRRESETFGKWFGIELSAENKKQLLLPENFAHGFLTLTDEAEVLMKVTTYYHLGDEIGFAWDDPDVNIEWPLLQGVEPILAEKDTKWKSFRETFLNL